MAMARTTQWATVSKTCVFASRTVHTTPSPSVMRSAGFGTIEAAVSNVVGTMNLPSLLVYTPPDAASSLKLRARLRALGMLAVTLPAFLTAV